MNGFFVACLERRGPALDLKRKAEVADDDDLDSLVAHDTHPSIPKKKKKRKKQKTVD